MNPGNLQHLMARAARRELADRAIRFGGWGLVCGIAPAACALILNRVAGLPISVNVYPALAVLGLLGGVVFSVSTRADRLTLAVRLDRALRLKDRIGTAESLVIAPGAPGVQDAGFAELARRDAEKLANAIDYQSATPIRITGIWAVALPLAALLWLGVWLLPVVAWAKPDAASSRQAAQENAIINQQAQQVAQSIDQAVAQLPKSDALTQQARQDVAALDRLAQQLASKPASEQELTSARDESAARVGELADQLAEQSQRDLAVADEMAKRFSGLDKTDGPKPPMTAEEFSNALRRGDFGEAAKHLENLLNDEHMTNLERQAAAKHLRDLARKLDQSAEQSPTSAQERREQLSQVLKDQGLDEKSARELLDNPPPSTDEIEKNLRDRNVDPDIAHDLARDLDRLRRENDIDQQVHQETRDVKDTLDRAAQGVEQPPSERPSAPPPPPPPPPASKPDEAPAAPQDQSSPQPPQSQPQPQPPSPEKPTRDQKNQQQQSQNERQQPSNQQSQTQSQSQPDSAQPKQQQDQGQGAKPSEKTPTSQPGAQSTPAPQQQSDSHQQQQTTDQNQNSSDDQSRPSPTTQPDQSRSAEHQPQSQLQQQQRDQQQSQQNQQQPGDQSRGSSNDRGDRSQSQPQRAQPTPDQKQQPPKSTSQPKDAIEQSQEQPRQPASQPNAGDQQHSQSQQPQDQSQNQSQEQKPGDQSPADALRRLAERREKADQQNQTAERLRELAKQIMEHTTPEQRKQWSEQWLKQGADDQPKRNQLDQQAKQDQHPQPPSDGEQPQLSEEEQKLAKEMQDIARDMAEKMSPEERQKLMERLQRQSRANQPQDQHAGGADDPSHPHTNTDGDGSPAGRHAGDAPSSPPERLQGQATKPLDLRGKETNDQLIARWLDKNAKPAEPGRTDQSVPPQEQVRNAQQIAERAVNESVVQKRYHKAIQRYFGRLNETMQKAADDKASPGPTTQPQN